MKRFFARPWARVVRRLFSWFFGKKLSSAPLSSGTRTQPFVGGLEGRLPPGELLGLPLWSALGVNPFLEPLAAAANPLRASSVFGLTGSSPAAQATESKPLGSSGITHAQGAGTQGADLNFPAAGEHFARSLTAAVDGVADDGRLNAGDALFQAWWDQPFRSSSSRPHSLSKVTERLFDAETELARVLNSQQVSNPSPASPTPSISYSLSDAGSPLSVLLGNGGPSVNTVGPDAIDDTATTDEDTPVTFDVLANDVNPNHAPLTLTIVGSPTGGSAIVDTHGTPTDPVDDFITYTPNANFSGTGTVRYRIEEEGGSDEATVTITVNPVNDARIVLPIDQGSDEGESVSLSLQTPDRVNSSLMFSASGLPAGLTINSTTGVITGCTNYSAAQTQDGRYEVTVSATGAGDSDSQTFTWSWNDSNRIRVRDTWGRQGEFAAVLLGPSEDCQGNPITWTVGNLPPGLKLEVDPGAGYWEIRGTLETGPGGTEVYAVTVSASSSGTTDERTIAYKVLRGPGPELILSIGTTYISEDDIALVNPPTPSALAVTLYYPASPGPHEVNLAITPNDYSTLNVSTISLQDGQTNSDVRITPVRLSQQEDDVVVQARVDGNLVAQGAMTNVDISVQQNIRAKNTPTGMPDRIPPRVATEVEYTVNPALAKKELWLSVRGTIPMKNGRAGFKGTGPKGPVINTAVQIGSSGGTNKVNLIGAQQTEPGSGGNLTLTIRDGIAGGKTLVSSKGFSVAAIPSAVKMYDVAKIEGLDLTPKDPKFYSIEYGAGYKVAYMPDSGVDKQGNPIYDDLNEITIREQIKRDYATKVGEFLIVQLSTSSWLPGNATNKRDYNTYAYKMPRVFQGERVTDGDAKFLAVQVYRKLVNEKENGTAGVLQYHEFADKRTGVTQDAPVIPPNSGFKIDYIFEKAGDGKYYIKVTREAKANNGTEAGIIVAADTIRIDVEVKE